MPVQTLSTTVQCDGGKGALGHPRVFLNIDKSQGTIECPYCGQLFKFFSPKTTGVEK